MLLTAPMLARAGLNMLLRALLRTLEEMTFLLPQLQHLALEKVVPKVLPTLLVAALAPSIAASLAMELLGIRMCRVRFRSPLPMDGMIPLTVPVVLAERVTAPTVVVCRPWLAPALCGLLSSTRALAQVRTAATKLVPTLNPLLSSPITVVTEPAA